MFIVGATENETKIFKLSMSRQIRWYILFINLISTSSIKEHNFYANMCDLHFNFVFYANLCKQVEWVIFNYLYILVGVDIFITLGWAYWPKLVRLPTIWPNPITVQSLGLGSSNPGGVQCSWPLFITVLKFYNINVGSWYKLFLKVGCWVEGVRCMNFDLYELYPCKQ